MEGATRLAHTSPIRFAFGLFGIYFDRSPAGIRAETSWGGEMVAPRRGRIFECLKLFHIAASLQNIFGFMHEYAHVHTESGGVNNAPEWQLGEHPPSLANV